MGTENKGTFCLAVPAKAMAEVWETQDDQIKINYSLNVEREMEDVDRPLFEPGPTPPSAMEEMVKKT